MKILLLEELPIFDKETVKNYKTMDDFEKEEIVTEFIQKSENKNLTMLRETIKYTFDRWGLDPNKNQFYDYWLEFPFSPKGKEFQSLDDFVQMVSDGKVSDVSKDYYKEESLFNRTPQEFEYTVNAFELVDDPQEIKKYFKDTTYISVDQFYDETGKIKPAGNSSTAKDIDTIYGTIEQWSVGENGADNDITHYEVGSYSLSDVLKRFNISNKEVIPVITDWIKDYGTLSKTTRFYMPDRKRDMAYYVNKFTQIMNFKQLEPLTKEQKKSIMQKSMYSTIEDIPGKVAVDGKIIFLRELHHLSRPTDEMEFNDFAIYKNGNWQRYDDYISKQTSGKNLSAAKNRLMTDRDIEEVGNKYSIVAGIMYLLDNIKI